ncbi:MAG: ABC transporter permease [Gemmatimonadota bacterium]
MNPVDGIRLALEQIRTQKLKAGFAVLGVLIGSMFLMTVVSVAEGMNRYMEEDFARQVYGLNTLTLRRTPAVLINPSASQRRAWARRPRLTLDDARAIRTQLDAPARIAVASDVFGTVIGPEGVEVENVWMTAASADYFRIREYDIARGRLFTVPEAERGTPVIVLGAQTAELLFEQRDPVGRTVRIEGFPYRVIGVLERLGSLFGMSLDNQAIAPARSPLGRSVNPRGVVDEILVRTETTDLMAPARLELEAIMRVRHRLEPSEPNSFEIETADDSMSFWTTVSRILFTAFPALVGIALVVGGMVIMNIMLVSVVERTREIGIRKAVGARRRDILLQVLIESGTLSGLGAGVGIALGVLLAALVRALSPLPAAIAPHWIVLSAVLGIGVGVAAGVYPASRAARLDPVVALQRE